MLIGGICTVASSSGSGALFNPQWGSLDYKECICYLQVMLFMPFFCFCVLQDPPCLGPFLSLISSTGVADPFNECVYTSVIASSLGPCEG